jgi:hypothetical protein
VRSETRGKALGPGVSVFRCFGASVLRCFGASVLRCFGASVLRCFGAGRRERRAEEVSLGVFFRVVASSIHSRLRARVYTLLREGSAVVSRSVGVLPTLGNRRPWCGPITVRSLRRMRKEARRMRAVPDDLPKHRARSATETPAHLPLGGRFAAH